MNRSIHTKAIAVTAVVAALAIPAVAGANSPSGGYRFTTDTLGGNGQAPEVQGYTIITDTLGGNGVAPARGFHIITDTLGGNGGANAAPDVFERYAASHPYGRGLEASQPQGFRFITDTLGGNGGPGTVAAASDGGFSWSDAGIGAGIAVGAIALLAASLLLLRQLRYRQLQAA
jgi:hypothetical protein